MVCTSPFVVPVKNTVVDINQYCDAPDVFLNRVLEFDIVNPPILSETFAVENCKNVPVPDATENAAFDAS